MRKIIYIGIILFIGTISYSQELFDEERAFLTLLKLDEENAASFYEEYLYRFDQDRFKVYLEDEFEMYSAKKRLIENIKKFKTDAGYHIIIKSNYGEYDFDKKAFAFLPFPETYQHEILGRVLFPFRIKTNSQILLSFTNGIDIIDLPMEMEKANFLVKLNKNPRTGKIDRSVYLKVIFDLEPLVETTEQALKEKKILYANIKQVEVFESEIMNAEALATIKTAYGFQQEAAPEGEEDKKKEEVVSQN